MFSMKRTGACGADGICVRVIMLCFDAIAPALLHIVNSCLESCDFPPVWKHSLVHPIFKSGDPALVSNYRPISLVPVMAKIVERAVQRQLFSYMSDNHLLSPSQHGFRPFHSTETALITVSDQIYSAMDRGHLSLLCILDLSKCFDVIPHSKLLSKLQLYNVNTDWFCSYLSGHTQSVCITDTNGNRMISDPLPNTMGIFQGSALGPLLFTIFANDLSLYAPDAHITQYADDTQLLISDRKCNLPIIIQRMESTLSSIATWLHAHGLKLNTSKTEILLLGTKQNTRGLPPVSIRLGGDTVQESRVVRNLGVLFDRHLSWEAHVSSVVSKCVGLLIGLRHLRRYLPQNVMLTVVRSLVISHVNYCIAVYGQGTVQNERKLLKVVNFAARVVAGLRKFDHVTATRNELRLITPRRMCDDRTMIVAHSAMARGEPSGIADLLQTNAAARASQRVTRSDSQLRPPAIRTATGQRSFSCRATRLLNQVDISVRQLEPQGFKRVIRSAP